MLLLGAAALLLCLTPPACFPAAPVFAASLLYDKISNNNTASNMNNNNINSKSNNSNPSASNSISSNTNDSNSDSKTSNTTTTTTTTTTTATATTTTTSPGIAATCVCLFALQSGICQQFLGRVPCLPSRCDAGIGRQSSGGPRDAWSLQDDHRSRLWVVDEGDRERDDEGEQGPRGETVACGEDPAPRLQRAPCLADSRADQGSMGRPGGRPTRAW
jgi:hypothetical protein